MFHEGPGFSQNVKQPPLDQQIKLINVIHYSNLFKNIRFVRTTNIFSLVPKGPKWTPFQNTPIVKSPFSTSTRLSQEDLNKHLFKGFPLGSSICQKGIRANYPKSRIMGKILTERFQHENIFFVKSKLSRVKQRKCFWRDYDFLFLCRSELEAKICATQCNSQTQRTEAESTLNFCHILVRHIAREKVIWEITC